MKSFLVRWLGVALVASLAAPLSAQITNLPPGTTTVPVVYALPPPPGIIEDVTPIVTRSNGVAAVRSFSGLPDREIQPVPGGGRAEFGLLKAFFPVDVRAGGPVTLTAPDGRVLSFQATFIALHDLASNQSLLLAELTNRVGEIIGANEVIYTNCFDTLGADLRYRLSETGSALEQDLLLLEAPELPPAFSPENTRLEIWTAWFASAPVATSRQTIDLRATEPSGLLPPSLMENVGLDFGAARIVNGRAFSSSAQDETTPVGKSWVHLGGLDWLIESVDYLAVKAKLDLLPKARRSASNARPQSQREALIRSLATQKTAVPAAAPGSGPGDAAQTQPQLAARATLGRGQAATASPPQFVLDFVIVSSVPVPSGVVSWWPAGGNALDVITNNHGTLNSPVAYGPGEVGPGFIFSGGYVAATNSASLNPTNGLTVETWLYFTNSANMPAINKDTPTGRQYLISKFSNNKIRACVNSTNGSYYFTESQTVLQTNTWYHVALTYDAATSNLKTYINGVLDTNGVASGSMVAKTSPLNLGGAASWGYYWKGGLDEPAIYDRALGDSEILAIYNAGAAGKINPQLYHRAHQHCRVVAGRWPCLRSGPHECCHGERCHLRIRRRGSGIFLQRHQLRCDRCQ